VSDYLLHLVGRVLGTQDVLRPVLLSLFEAAAFGEVSVESEPAAQAATPDAPMTVARSQAIRQVHGIQTSVQADDRHAEPLREQTEVLETRVPQVQPPVELPTAQLPRAIVEVISRHEREELFERSIVEQHARELHEIVTAHAAIPPGSGVAPAARLVGALGVETRRVVAPLRRTDPRSAPEMVSGLPDVRISIGRVEVRAVLPTPDAPRVRREAAPAEGRPLGEYLAERGGQRR